MKKIQIQKSSRHSKITGDFAESLILYFLSKHGFECAKVDHTGIDLIARNPLTNEVMGISVKSRSRNEGKEGQYLSIPNDNFEKVNKACLAFNCVPYFALSVDEKDSISVYIIKSSHLLDIFPMRKRVSGWKMSEKWLKTYQADNDIIKFSLAYNISNWWTNQ